MSRRKNADLPLCYSISLENEEKVLCLVGRMLISISISLARSLSLSLSPGRIIVSFSQHKNRRCHDVTQPSLLG